ncbi:DUF7118 family protein [Halocatena pleomorpha]|uniref:Uncharacterized protein n=1 Tax=Halocatena pleomorpha TaxID=1785090 RepID=A0A3P3R6L5_9EURY|nr:hypothetical protein [Halocatena pleomorpha]RRJ29112.1 hypothetical protein EIK79_13295 [Halocatena pleomorpha]
MSDAVETLRNVVEEYDTVHDRVESVGIEELRAVSTAYHDVIELFDRYEERATDWDDFEGYVEFQEKLVDLIEGLPAELPEREAFEAADEQLHQQTLSAAEFDRARSALQPAAEYAELLDRYRELRERYDDARHAVSQQRDATVERIERLERLQRFETVDLDASVDRIRTPIKRYNDTVGAAFETFRAETSTRTVLSLVATTEQYPLVDYRQPPPALCEYVMTHEAGTEPIPTLLEYADYSRSKLSHYVDDPQALFSAVRTSRTYLSRLDGSPLEIAWPPPSAGALRYQIRERIAVAGRFAPEKTVPQLRELRSLCQSAAYERLRKTAVAHDRLGDDDRERIRNGSVDRDLERAREKRQQLDAVLDEQQIS